MFFQGFGAAIAQKKSTTSANFLGTFADECAQEVLNKKEGFVWFPCCASALPPVSREPASKMADSIVVELVLRGEEQKAMLLAAHLHLLVRGFEVYAGAYEGAPGVSSGWVDRARSDAIGRLSVLAGSIVC